MVTRMIVTSLVILSLSARLPVYSAGKLTAPQTTQGSQVKDVKSQIDKIDIGDGVTIILINGKIFLGYLTRVGDSEFEIGNAVRDSYTTFKYEEVARVDRGFDPGFRKIDTGNAPPQAPPPLDARAEAMRSRIEGIGVGEHVKIQLRNGKKFYGLITRVDDYDFDIADFGRQVVFAVRYSDMKKVDQDRSHRNLLVAGIIATGAVAIIGIMLMKRNKPEPNFPFPPF